MAARLSRHSKNELWNAINDSSRQMVADSGAPRKRHLGHLDDDVVAKAPELGTCPTSIDVVALGIKYLIAGS